MVQWLILVPSAPAGPVVVENLPLVQLVRSDLVLWKLKGPLKRKNMLLMRKRKRHISVYRTAKNNSPHAAGKLLCTPLHLTVCPLRLQPSSFSHMLSWQESHRPEIKLSVC